MQGISDGMENIPRNMCVAVNNRKMPAPVYNDDVCFKSCGFYTIISSSVFLTRQLTVTYVLPAGSVVNRVHIFLSCFISFLMK